MYGRPSPASSNFHCNDQLTPAAASRTSCASVARPGSAGVRSDEGSATGAPSTRRGVQSATTASVYRGVLTLTAPDGRGLQFDKA